MVKLRKQRRRKVYRHNVNRKRMRNKQFNEGNINCKEIKNAWDSKKSLKANLKDMGICYDPNETFKITVSKKEKITKVMPEIEEEWKVEDNEDTTQKENSKSHVIDALIADATAPRVSMFRLPNSQVEFLTYMLTKHGLNYKAMVKDKKNYDQHTWKQLRAKIKRFQSIPEQYNKFLEKASKSVLAKLQQDVVMEDDD